MNLRDPLEFQRVSFWYKSRILRILFTWSIYAPAICERGNNVNKEKNGDKALLLCIVLLFGAICVEKLWDKGTGEPVYAMYREDKSTEYKGDKLIEEQIQESVKLQNDLYEDSQNTMVNTFAESVAAEGSLFIGDSRTVGLKDYAGIEDAVFFAKTGMSVYSVNEEILDVEGFGEVSLQQVLNSGKFGRVYLMLGINELGYDFGQTMFFYEELVKQIKEAQPQALIFLQANLHVTQERSDNDNVVNNVNIDSFNERVEQLADGKQIFYLDANVLFDDENGNLAAETNSDNVHLHAECYSKWGEWIIKEAENLLSQ